MDGDMYVCRIISTIINEYIFKGLKQEQMVHHCFVSIGLVNSVFMIMPVDALELYHVSMSCLRFSFDCSLIE